MRIVTSGFPKTLGLIVDNRMFADVMEGKEQMPQVHVINPHIDGRYKSTVEGIFGEKIQWVKKKAEAIEWYTYLK